MPEKSIKGSEKAKRAEKAPKRGANLAKSAKRERQRNAAHLTVHQQARPQNQLKHRIIMRCLAYLCAYFPQTNIRIIYDFIVLYRKIAPILRRN